MTSAPETDDARTDPVPVAPAAAASPTPGPTAAAAADPAPDPGPPAATTPRRAGRSGRVLRVVLGGASALLLVAGVAVGCTSAAAPPPNLLHADPTVLVDGDVPPLRTAPDPATVPAPLWAANLSGPDPLANFRDTPYNNDGAKAPVLVDVPGVPGRKGLQFTVPAGGKRSELEPQTDGYREGDEAWFGFAWNLPAGFPTTPSGFQIVAQWKNSGEGSPPVEIKVADGQFLLDGGAGGDNPQENYFSVPIGPARTGVQSDLVVHIKFSDDPTKALVDVWMNGQQRVVGFRPPGGSRYQGDDSYLKTGIYRDPANTRDAQLVLVDARVAGSYPSAAALVGP